MRWLTPTAFCGLLSLVAAVPAQQPYEPPESQPAKPKPDPQPDPAMVRLRAAVNPETPAWDRTYVVERCAEHLATINREDRYRIRYFDLSAVPRQEMPAMSSSLFFVCNSTARIPVTYVPRAVPNTDNRVFWVDLAWFNWRAETWESISQEEPYTVEPILDSTSRALLFLKQETRANAVVRGDWFVHYAMDNGEFLKGSEETDDFNEKAFYYQLLYSNVEFDREVVEKVETVVKTTKKETRTVTRTDPYGRQYQTQETIDVPVETKQVEEKKVKKKVKGVGPKNTTELEAAWFVDFGHLRDFPVDKTALVDKGFSGVAHGNRIMWRVRTKIGVYWRTFDVFRVAGDQDFVQNPFPKKFNAGEHIIQDERGAQFYHLSNGTGGSTDYADPFVVKGDPMNSHNTVLVTSRSCVHCHDKGILPWRDEHAELRKEGVKIQFYDYARAERFNQAFLQAAKLQRLRDTDQENYSAFIRECNGLTAPENTQNFLKARTWYLRDVTLAQAARELGTTVKEFSDALGIGIGTIDDPMGVTNGRLGRLILGGRGVPRHTWERGLYQEAGLLLLEHRKAAKIQKEANYP